MAAKFTSPPNRDAYYDLVWNLVRQIPEGKVSTYGQIAGLIPPPEGMSLKDYDAWAARWVGGAMARCPDDVPWHRVINAQGKISQRAGGGYLVQQDLLENEGVEFDDRQRVDFSRFRWAGPSDEWMRAHGLPPLGGT